jgi:hypothetical protein
VQVAKAKWQFFFGGGGTVLHRRICEWPISRHWVLVWAADCLGLFVVSVLSVNVTDIYNHDYFLKPSLETSLKPNLPVAVVPSVVEDITNLWLSSGGNYIFKCDTQADTRFCRNMPLYFRTPVYSHCLEDGSQIYAYNVFSFSLLSLIIRHNNNNNNNNNNLSNLNSFTISEASYRLTTWLSRYSLFLFHL